MTTSLKTSSQMDFANLAIKVKDVDVSGAVDVTGAVAVGSTLNVTGTTTLGTANITTLNPTSIVRSIQLNVPLCGQAKVGATAGWVITGGTDKSHATLPASQTSSTLVVPFPPLPVGSTVTAVAVAGQVESAGNNATLTLSFRRQTNAASDNTDAQIASGTTGALAADTVISAANLGVTAQTEVVATGTELYALITGTTAASTDVDLTHLLITYTTV